MANKSIKATATLDNPAVTTRYQVKANPVNTFVSGSGDNRGQQVAEALSKVGGSLMNLANTNAQIKKEAERQATALQKDQARVLAQREATLFKQAQQSANYNEDSNYEGSFNTFVNSEKGQGYTEARESLIDNPQALAVFENTFRMQTETPFIEAVGAAILKQKKDTISGLLPPVLAEAQAKYPNDPTAVFKSVESQLYSRLTAEEKDGGYGLSKAVGAEVLGDVFNTLALSRDKDGRANTFLAEQYIMSGKGGNDMREKLTLTILKQQSLAASERSVRRTEAKLEEDKRTKELEVMLMSNEWLTKDGKAVTDSNILANKDLSDNQKIYLVDINQKVNRQKAIAAEPSLKAEAKKLLLKTERSLLKSAVSGDFTPFGFGEGYVPTAEELETRLTELYLGKMANENDFNQLIKSAQNSLSIDEFIDNTEIGKPLKTQFNQLKDQFKANSFNRYMKNYSKAILEGKPVLTHLNEQVKREVYELVEQHVESGNNLTTRTLSGFYEEAAAKVMQPIIEYANSNNKSELLNRSQESEDSAEGLAIGTIDSGYRYIGGDPNAQESWEPVEQTNMPINKEADDSDGEERSILN